VITLGLLEFILGVHGVLLLSTWTEKHICFDYFFCCVLVGPWCRFGLPWAHPGGHFWFLWALFGGPWVNFGSAWVHLGATLVILGVTLGSLWIPWMHLGVTWDPWGGPEGHFGRPWTHFGGAWNHSGTPWEVLVVTLGLLEFILGVHGVLLLSTWTEKHICF
jgi:hypothetical protein